MYSVVVVDGDGLESRQREALEFALCVRLADLGNRYRRKNLRLRYCRDYLILVKRESQSREATTCHLLN